MHSKQKGAAVVMSMFIVVLCTLAVSPLIWTLFATAKSVSVDSSRAQASQVALSGIDWARVILREDARVSVTDTMTEPWAVPLAESRLSEGLMRRNESVSNLEDREAVLKGKIEDAQGRFNLRNLGGDIANRDDWLVAFERLSELLGINNAQRGVIEQAVLLMYPKPNESEGGTGLKPPSPKIIPAQSWNEFRGQYGIEQVTWEQLRPHVAILPRATKVNINTAGAEVIYAAITGMGFGDAQGLIYYRERVTFRNLNDLRPAIGANLTPNNDLIDVKSDYFLVQGETQVREALIRTEALLERRDRRVYVLWRHD